MATVDPDSRPILEMFSRLLQQEKVKSVLGDWQKTFADYMFHFGTKERLSDDLTFNMLFYTRLNPSFSRAAGKLVLDAEIEIVGVVANRAFRHTKFNYLRTEMLSMRAFGRWDYERNDRFRRIRLIPGMNLNIPPEIEFDPRINAKAHLAEIGRLCASWLLLHPRTSGGAGAVEPETEAEPETADQSTV